MSKKYNIVIKSAEEIQLMSEAGKILADIINQLKCSLKSGMTTKDLDKQAENFIDNSNVISAFKGYRGFPGCACVSVNNEVVHGIPGEYVIKDGDIVSVDVGIIYKGFYSDTAITIPVGKVDSEIQILLDVTRDALYEGIGEALVGNCLSDISHAIEKYVKRHKLSIVREFVGHGIGRSLHEDPEIPNFGSPHQGPLLKKGMVFAIEPMVNLGTHETQVLDDGWTVVTRDGQYSAHFEHSVAITDDGPKILTEYV